MIERDYNFNQLQNSWNTELMFATGFLNFWLYGVCLLAEK